MWGADCKLLLMVVQQLLCTLCSPLSEQTISFNFFHEHWHVDWTPLEKNALDTLFYSCHTPGKQTGHCRLGGQGVKLHSTNPIFHKSYNKHTFVALGITTSYLSFEAYHLARIHVNQRMRT
jgi:hypothetical protein